MAKDEEDEEDLDDESKKESDDEFEEENVSEGGIFDEDLDALGDDVEAVISDFDIGSTILGVGAPVQSWSGQNLEETLSREHVEKDWGDEDRFVGGDLYQSSKKSSDVYSSDNKNDFYSTHRGNDVYSSSGNDVYGSKKENESYSGQPPDLNKLKTHERIMGERRGNSLLESMGFEDRDKRRHDRFASDSITLNEE